MTDQTLAPKTKYVDMQSDIEKLTWLRKYKQWHFGLADEDRRIREEAKCWFYI